MKHSHFIIFNIYRLRNPIDNSIFYVGMTRIGLDARLKQHITESNCLTDKIYNRRNLVKANYIHEMRVMGHLPIIELIETHNVVTNENHSNACIREHYWMEFYKKQGEPILNIVGVKRPCGVIKREHLSNKIYPPLERLIKKN